MSTKTGKLSVETNDILPIIKKWLYSEHDIFIRELVSNASDAITKRHTLSSGKTLRCQKARSPSKSIQNKKPLPSQIMAWA